MKYYKYLLFAIIVFILQIGILSSLSLNYEICIFPVIVFFLAILAPLEVCLVFGTTVGFLYDISTLQRIPFQTIFLLAEIIFLVILKKYVVNLSNVLGRTIAIFFIVCTYQLLKAIVFYQGFQVSLLWVTLINFVLAVIIFEFIYKYRKSFLSL